MSEKAKLPPLLLRVFLTRLSEMLTANGGGKKKKEMKISEAVLKIFHSQ